MDQSTRPEKVRTLRLNIRLSRQEWDRIHKLSANTTCRSISEYARKVLAEKPVKVFYRNRSFDEFEEQMTRLLPQLETFCEYFEQTAKRISSPNDTLETKAALALLQSYGEMFSERLSTIKTHIEKLAGQCDQK